MYKDSELINCPECGELGLYAPDLWGKPTFHHKIPSKIEGYFTFSMLHKITNKNLRKAN